MKNIILIVTSSEEPNIKNVTPFLEKMEAKIVRVNNDLLFHDYGPVTFGLVKNNWMLSIGDESIYPSDVKSIWYRRPHLPKINESVSPLYQEFVRNESSKFSLCAWSMFDYEDVLWVNHPSKLKTLEFNKPYQMFAATRVGLRTPRTLITNDAQASLNFFDECHGEVISKLFGGTGFVQDEDNNTLVVYTHRVHRQDIENNPESMRSVPTVFQEYIPKRLELRITVVGENIFSCAIYSQDSIRTKDDWRKYDFANVKHEPFRLPKEVSEKILQFMKSLGIVFGAIDMILTPDGEYVFLEVNPSGQWGWIEVLTGLPISESIANLLMCGV